MGDRARAAALAALLAAGGGALRISARPSQQECKAAGQPTAVAATVQGLFITLTWQAPPGPVSSYEIEVGLTPGTGDVAVIETGNPGTSVTGVLPAGVYFVHLRARNACGVGEMSSDARVVSGVYQDHGDVVVARRTAERNTYFPSIAKLRNGELLVAYYDGPDHVSPSGRIALVRSRDGGMTWSLPEVALDTPLDDRDPTLTVTSSGRVLLSYFAGKIDTAEDGGGVFVAWSDDSARTWSTPQRVATSLLGAATTSAIVTLPTGELLMPIYGHVAGTTRSRAVAVRSRDDGMTWPATGETLLAAADAIDFQEPAVAQIGAGWLAVFRTEQPGSLAFHAVSNDGARSWSPATRLDIAAQASELVPVPQAPGSTIDGVHIWGDWSRRYGDSRPTMIQSVRWPTDTTSPRLGEPRVVYNSHCDDAAAPSGVMLDEYRLLVVFYDACLGYIGGTFVDVRTLK